MRIRERTLTVWGIAMVAVALLAGVGGMRHTPGPAAAQEDPAAVFQHAVDAFNLGDVDTLMDLYADDAVLQSLPLCEPVECVGKDAIRNHNEFFVADNARLTVTGSEVSGDTATGSVNLESDSMRAAGVERIVVSYVVEVRDGRIADYRFMPDLTDPETADFVAHLGANSIRVDLGPGRDADQSPGTAVLIELSGRTNVLVTIPPGPAGVPQPAHIHEGTCADLGAAVFTLQDVGGGKSGTGGLDVSLSDLQTGNHAINVHRSQDEPDVYVACGDIPAAAAEEAPPVEPAPAAEEAPVVAPAPAEAMPVAGSGGFLDEEGSGLPTWWYALVAGGTLLVLGGLVGLRRNHSRRQG